jgi:hypothetical protein
MRRIPIGRLQLSICSAITLLTASHASAAVVADYPFTDDDAPATSVDPDTGSRADDFVLATPNSSISAGSNNLFLRSQFTPATETQAVLDEVFVSFTWTPLDGTPYDLTSLAFGHGASNSPNPGVPFTASVTVKADVDGFGFGASDPSLGTFAKTVQPGNGGAGLLDPHSIYLTAFGDAFDNITGPVEFRFYIFDDQDHNDRINRLDSVVLNGNPVPEPTTVGLLGLGAAIGLARRARRR